MALSSTIHVTFPRLTVRTGQATVRSEVGGLAQEVGPNLGARGEPNVSQCCLFRRLRDD